jgi:hypothetical protein
VNRCPPIAFTVAALGQNAGMTDVSIERTRNRRKRKIVSGPVNRQRDHERAEADERPASAYAIVAALSVFAAIVTLYATKQGVGLAFDSINYLTAAHNLASGHGLRTGTLEPFTIAPPGLSALLAPAVWAGWDEESAARFAGIACYAATVPLAFVLARRHLRSVAASVFVAAATALSSSLLFVMTLALTEPMFVVIALAFILVAERNWHTWTAKGLLAMIVLTWLAFAFRYLGLFLIPSGIICILASTRINRARAVFGAGVFLAGSLLFPLLWMARNHAADGTLMGPRPGSLETVAGVRTQLFDVLQSWVWPDVTTTSAYWAALLAGVVVAFAVLRRKSTATYSFTSHASLWPMVIVSVLYLSYLSYGELTTSVDPIDRRLMAPLFVPVLVLAVRLIERSIDNLPSIWPYVAGGASLFLVVQGASMIDAAKAGADDGIYLQNDAFRKEPQALALAGIGEHDAIFSNVRMNFWVAIRHQPARNWPRHYVHHSPTLVDEVPAFLDSLGCGPTYAVWYGKETDPPGEFLSPSELQQFVNLKPLQTFPTGINYLVEPKQPVTPKTEADCKKMHLRL